MARLAPDTRVDMAEQHRRELSFPPPPGADLVIAVHAQALMAAFSTLTQLVGVKGTDVVWAGAVDERMVMPAVGTVPDARKGLWARLMLGPRLWQVVRPGLLTRPGVSRPLLTVYDGDRPWVVVGELEGGTLVGAPLNDARGNPKWWTPLLRADQLGFAGSKPSQLELAHLWTLPAALPSAGAVQAGGDETIAQVASRYL